MTMTISRRDLFKAFIAAGALATVPATVEAAVKAVEDRGVIAPFLPCDGRRLSRKVYSELFDVIGIIYDHIDDGKTFMLPAIVNSSLNTTRTYRLAPKEHADLSQFIEHLIVTHARDQWPAGSLIMAAGPVHYCASGGRVLVRRERIR